MRDNLDKSYNMSLTEDADLEHGTKMQEVDTSWREQVPKTRM